MNKDENFSFRIKKIRERKKLTQKELSIKSGLTASAISQIEKGSREPCLSSIIKLCNALEISSDLLIGVEKIDDNFNAEIKIFIESNNKKEVDQFIRILSKSIDDIYTCFESIEIDTYISRLKV